MERLLAALPGNRLVNSSLANLPVRIVIIPEVVGAADTEDLVVQYSGDETSSLLPAATGIARKPLQPATLNQWGIKSKPLGVIY